jgi:hypothetical protein
MLAGKPGLGPIFPRAWDKTNRVLEQAQFFFSRFFAARG